jgi:hypothetical protein
MHHNGSTVTSEYTDPTTNKMVAQIQVMMLLTGMRNATRPPKKRRREAWRRRGMISTTECI